MHGRVIRSNRYHKVLSTRTRIVQVSKSGGASPDRKKRVKKYHQVYTAVTWEKDYDPV